MKRRRKAYCISSFQISGILILGTIIMWKIKNKMYMYQCNISLVMKIFSCQCLSRFCSMYISWYRISFGIDFVKTWRRKSIFCKLKNVISTDINPEYKTCEEIRFLSYLSFELQCCFLVSRIVIIIKLKSYPFYLQIFHCLQVLRT